MVKHVKSIWRGLIWLNLNLRTSHAYVYMRMSHARDSGVGWVVWKPTLLQENVHMLRIQATSQIHDMVLVRSPVRPWTAIGRVLFGQPPFCIQWVILIAEWAW